MDYRTSLHQAQQYMQQGLYQEAITCYTELIDEDETRWELLQLRAIAYRKVKQYEPALSDHDRLLNLMPRQADAYCERGITRYHAGDGQGALEDMDRAVDLEPEKAYRWASRAYIRGHLKDQDGAIEDYQQALRIDPDDAIVQNNLGILEDSRGYRDQAKARFKKADQLAKTSSHLQEGRPNQPKAKPESYSEMKTDSSQVSVEQPQEGLSAYLRVIGAVFTSPQERQAFWHFVRRQLGLARAPRSDS